MRRSIFCLLMVLTLPLIASQSQAQSISISVEVHGQVRYAERNTPAENVLVRLDFLSGGMVSQVMTDRNGKFRFSNLRQTQYIITVRAQGFREVQQQVDLETATSNFVILQLVPDKSNRTGPITSGGVIDTRVPADARKEFEKGEAALLSGQKEKFEEGIAHLEKAASIYPDFFEAQLLIGTAYMDAGQWEKAERALSLAHKIKPQSAVALFGLGEVYRRQKHYTEAEKALQEGLKLDEKSWQGHLTLGRVYWELGQLAKAGPQVGRALQLKPDLADAHLLAGNILFKAHQPENALTEFEEYLRLAPQGEFASQARELARKIRQALADKKR